MLWERVTEISNKNWLWKPVMRICYENWFWEPIIKTAHKCKQVKLSGPLVHFWEFFNKDYVSCLSSVATIKQIASVNHLSLNVELMILHISAHTLLAGNGPSPFLIFPANLVGYAFFIWTRLPTTWPLSSKDMVTAWVSTPSLLWTNLCASRIVPHSSIKRVLMSYP